MFITPNNRHFFQETLDLYFKKRYEVFIKRRKWNISHTNEREIDQFDNEHTCYIIWEEQGQVLGGVRMLPTNKPYLLGDLFSYMLEGKAPKNSYTWEISRFFLDLPEHYPRKTQPAVRRLFSSVIEFGCLVKAKKFVALTEPHIEEIMRNIGIPWERTSQIFPIPEGGSMVSGETVVSLDVYHSVRQSLPEKHIASWIPVTPDLLNYHKNNTKMLPIS